MSTVEFGGEADLLLDEILAGGIPGQGPTQDQLQQASLRREHVVARGWQAGDRLCRIDPDDAAGIEIIQVAAK